jgi:hypothetical protein
MVHFLGVAVMAHEKSLRLSWIGQVIRRGKPNARPHRYAKRCGRGNAPAGASRSPTLNFRHCAETQFAHPAGFELPTGRL